MGTLTGAAPKQGSHYGSKQYVHVDHAIFAVLVTQLRGPALEAEKSHFEAIIFTAARVH